ncbi:hypothetical protein [Pseudomonas phage vB_PaeP_SIIA-P2]|uniref:Uncharacterized protein n=1 Tax=Pseudomonas phage LUZ24 TaxID=484895 RepID=A9J6Y7_BPLUZ|nr:hypothetical protein PPLUZ24_gp27 [Bruynoghevirus LUZ24]YP_009209357.1 hypothetical protein AVU27_gp39 [Pseudomonas phage DL54]AYD79658.1 hypothetical protein JNAJLEEC_00033 [Pseudomonas phage phiPA01_302]QHB49036.1 hypothetical protein U47_32 [Pseudomonas phage U47]QIQ67274.1 hypothetical protein oldone_32 [Pseudomonas phage oldone]QVJ12799.1 hypothetical protein [Pseudomonas phage PSA13]QVJ12871.1 hypothetical protein [Pseudomonas phage PSA16]QVJ13232.1 hypothetical protein [Pseudomonas
MFNRKLSISNILSSFDKVLVNLKTFIQESSEESERIYNEISLLKAERTQVMQDNLKAQKVLANLEELLGGKNEEVSG